MLLERTGSLTHPLSPVPPAGPLSHPLVPPTGPLSLLLDPSPAQHLGSPPCLGAQFLGTRGGASSASRCLLLHPTLLQTSSRANTSSCMGSSPGTSDGSSSAMSQPSTGQCPEGGRKVQGRVRRGQSADGLGRRACPAHLASLLSKGVTRSACRCVGAVPVAVVGASRSAGRCVCTAMVAVGGRAVPAGRVTLVPEVPAAASSPARELEDYMSDRVQFVITAQEWDPSFEEVGPRGEGNALAPLDSTFPC